MDITQVATLVNSVNNEIIGSSAILEEDLSNVVDVGKAVFDATSYDKYVAALVDHIGKVIFVDRKYTGELASLYRDNWEYGAVMEKIYVTDMPVAVENDSWKLTNGTSYDPNVFTQPSVAAKFYNKKTTFEVDLSVCDIQVRSAFDNATQLNAFISMLMNAVDTAINIRLEGLAERVVNTLIANTIYDDIPDLDLKKTGVKAVNLLKLYNDQFVKVTPDSEIYYAGYLDLTDVNLPSGTRSLTIDGDDEGTTALREVKSGMMVSGTHSRDASSPLSPQSQASIFSMVRRSS